MKRCLVLSAFIAIIMVLSGCHNKTVEQNVSELCSVPICLPLDSFIYVSIFQDKETDNYQSPYTMIVYLDSANCTRCSIKFLHEWNDLLYLEKEKKVNFMFIISTRDTLSLETDIKKSALRHGIYIDTCNVFIHNNPQIPTCNLYHTFMIDSSNMVNMVGNPIRNKKISILFHKILGIGKQNDTKKQ